MVRKVRYLKEQKEGVEIMCRILEEERNEGIMIGMEKGIQAVSYTHLSIGDEVKAGDVLGCVADPTKYYVVEGSNVYFSMTKDGAPIDCLLYTSDPFLMCR